MSAVAVASCRVFTNADLSELGFKNEGLSWSGTFEDFNCHSLATDTLEIYVVNYRDVYYRSGSGRYVRMRNVDTLEKLSSLIELL